MHALRKIEDLVNETRFFERPFAQPRRTLSPEKDHPAPSEEYFVFPGLHSATREKKKYPRSFVCIESSENAAHEHCGDAEMKFIRLLIWTLTVSLPSVFDPAASADC